jgi:hypothetical protein
LLYLGAQRGHLITRHRLRHRRQHHRQQADGGGVCPAGGFRQEVGQLSGASVRFRQSVQRAGQLPGLAVEPDLAVQLPDPHRHPGDTSIFTATATADALAGNYRVNISQVAQAQSLASGGYKSTTAAIGLGNKTTISFSLGSVSGGTFGLTGTRSAPA